MEYSILFRAYRKKIPQFLTQFFFEMEEKTETFLPPMPLQHPTENDGWWRGGGGTEQERELLLLSTSWLFFSSCCCCCHSFDGFFFISHFWGKWEDVFFFFFLLLHLWDENEEKYLLLAFKLRLFFSFVDCPFMAVISDCIALPPTNIL